MSRNQILAVGALLWSVAILDGLVHLATGAWMVTLIMVVAGIGGASVIAVRRGLDGPSPKTPEPSPRRRLARRGVPGIAPPGALN